MMNFLIYALRLDKEKLSKMCSESDEKLSEISKEYEIAVSSFMFALCVNVYWMECA